MPGPCSAPNGNGHLVDRTPLDSGANRIDTGKTALRYGQIRRWDDPRGQK